MCKSISDKIPIPPSPIFLENKTRIGTIDEVYGVISQVFFSVKMQEGFPADKFSTGDRFYIDSRRLLDLEK